MASAIAPYAAQTFIAGNDGGGRRRGRGGAGQHGEAADLDRAYVDYGGVIALTDGGRPLPRVGGLAVGEVKGEDGLR